MESKGFVDKSELATEEVPIPYYCIQLTPEQEKEIRYREFDFLNIDGKKIFPVRVNGVTTGYVIYIVFKP